MGHYTRILAMAGALEPSGMIRDSISTSFHSILESDYHFDWRTDGDFDWGGQSSWWIVDLARQGNFDGLRKLENGVSDFKILVVDQMNDVFPTVDLHVSPSPFRSKEHSRANVYRFGWEFVLSRFDSMPAEGDETRSPLGIVLTGGADSLGVLPLWSRSLARHEFMSSRIDLIRGPFVSDRLCFPGPSVRVLDGQTEFPNSLSTYDLGLVVHGVSTFDLLVSGVPVVVMPNPEADHYSEVRYLHDEGVAIMAEGFEQAVAEFVNLLQDEVRLSKMKKNLRMLLRSRSTFDMVAFLESL